MTVSGHVMLGKRGHQLELKQIGSVRPDRPKQNDPRSDMATHSQAVVGAPLLTKDRMGDNTNDTESKATTKRPAQLWTLTDLLGVNDCLAPMFSSTKRPVEQQEQLSEMLEIQKRKIALEGYVNMLKSGIVMTCYSGTVVGNTELVSHAGILFLSTDPKLARTKLSAEKWFYLKCLFSGLRCGYV